MQPTDSMDHPYFAADHETKAKGTFRLLQEDGTASPDGEAMLATFDRERSRELLAGMLRIRVTDARMMALQRQGRIGFYGEAMGQEAAVVGSAAASAPQDWIVPALREAGVGLYRGMSLDSYIAQIFGNAEDPTKGRQMPCHPCDVARRYVVMSSCVSTQIPHAVGIAMAIKISGDRDKVAFGFMGDGGTSEGDFHVAMNFAGVSKAPCVLICQNNQWAISTPSSVQTASPTIAIKALGYGIEPIRADGNDVFAVAQAVGYAAAKARRGDGPTFVELLTYRVSAHSSSDDPSRYRDEAVTELWKSQRDPLRRTQLFLEARGWLEPGEVQAMAATMEAEVREVIARQEKVGPPPVESLFDDVFEQPTWLLREQREQLLAMARTRSPHHHG
jgi:pyruvate dehydrogenase E1 component alpha subunit/2-oxoisovalerate dehydrogenase E1 component alpha subunit